MCEIRVDRRCDMSPQQHFEKKYQQNFSLMLIDAGYTPVQTGVCVGGVVGQVRSGNLIIGSREIALHHLSSDYLPLQLLQSMWGGG